MKKSYETAENFDLVKYVKDVLSHLEPDAEENPTKPSTIGFWRWDTGEEQLERIILNSLRYSRLSAAGVDGSDLVKIYDNVSPLDHKLAMTKAYAVLDAICNDEVTVREYREARAIVDAVHDAITDYVENE